MDSTSSLHEWARDEIASVHVRDRRHRDRLIRMLVGLGIRPSGRVLDVFETSAERQGAYDLLENGAVRADAVMRSVSEAALMRANERDVFVAVDGTSLTLTDRAGTKAFGAIGAHEFGARGLKVINAYALSPKGVPLGVTGQVWWSRLEGVTRNCQKRKLADKETRHWIDAIEQTCRTAADLDRGLRLCFLVDREGDGAHVLTALSESEHDFIVRSSRSRRLAGTTRKYLHDVIARTRPVGEYRMHIEGADGRSERLARMVIRFKRVTLRVRDRATEREWPLEVIAVQAREVGTTPRHEKPLAWTLLTNRAVNTLEEARAIVRAYSFRWRIEEMHRTWKTGECNVEDTQLRRADHVIKWATLMVATAARIERMKQLSRTTPDEPASTQLTPFEIEALVLTRRRTKKRTDPEPSLTPTIGEAVRWLADIGGYTGKSSGGPPGSVVIGRGFERIAPVALVLEQLKSEGRLR